MLSTGFSIITMPPIYHKKPATGYSILGPEFAPISSPALVIPLYNNLFQKFMQTCINRIQDQALATQAVEAKEKASDGLLKSKNPDLYYDTFHMEYYWFV